jgi:preprotein translocase subunit SecE
MATEEDLKKAEAEEAEEELPEASGEPEAVVRVASEAPLANADAPSDEESDADDDVQAPVQLGYQRYVYAAYMAFALLAAFLVAKAGHAAWFRLGQWKPDFGEPKDEIVFPLAGVVGVLVTLYYWRKQEARQYADEVAEELSKVTWPSRKEVTNSTTVVVLTTVFATVFFALMDRFWSFVTDKIYTF